MTHTPRTVAALYIDRRGHYPRMTGVECYDVARDAKPYTGPHPVVAHPPCGPWGRMKFLCTKQDPECATRAVEQVRTCGGVLEHPEHSGLWRARDLPRPGATDAHGGRTYYLRQVAWGHCAEKPTWLYVVGVPDHVVMTGLRTGGVATHRVTNGPRGNQSVLRTSTLKGLLTPPLFAEWLVYLARRSDLTATNR
jgi:hypothetical protein